MHTELPNQWVIETNWRTRLEEETEIEQDRLYNSIHHNKIYPKEIYNTGLLASGQIFCIESILSPYSKSATTIETITGVEVYKFSANLLITLGIKYNTNSMNFLSECLALQNPQNDKLSYYYRKQYLWEMKRSKIVESITKENDRLLPSLTLANQKLKQFKPMKYTSN